jgi:hypothetical protein
MTYLIALALSLAMPFGQATDSMKGMYEEILRTQMSVVKGIAFDRTGALERGSEGALQDIKRMLDLRPDWRLEVQAHAGDASIPAGDPGTTREAKVIVMWLTDHGIDPARLVAKGYGGSRGGGGGAADPKKKTV